MSCFRLPASLCKQIQSVLTRFWWDAKPSVRKRCLVSWSKLTLPKNIGRLGFREIECFNQYLLAKIAWRLIQDPTCLLAQTLRGNYYSSSSILDCQSPNSASHGWRGILWGRDLLIKSVGWSVGNGNAIKVLTDPWLSPVSPLCPMGRPTCASQDLHVSDLILPQTNSWKLQAIQLHLPQYEELILQIIPSSLNKKYELVWLPENLGMYTAKSGYATARLETQPATPDDFSWKKCIWNINSKVTELPLVC